MPDCGVTEFMRGGMVSEAHITASAITDSRVSSSELTGCNLKSLASVDTDSAAMIATALSQLSEGALLELAKAIGKALPRAALANGPAVTATESLPSAVAGNRETLLGQPANWLTYGDFIVPAYKEGQ